MSQGNRWDGVFSTSGEVWGTQPSPTGKLLISMVESMRDELIKVGNKRPEISVAEIGFGYGRDLAALLRLKNANLHAFGVDKSITGHSMASGTLKPKKGSSLWLSTGDFTHPEVPLRAESFHALLSHRVIHLLPTDASLERFAENAYHILKPGAFAVISARDHRDFKPDRMIMTNGRAVYTDRPDHKITLFDDERLSRLFERAGFFIDRIIPGEERESILHPDEKTYFSIIVAEKLTKQAQQKYETNRNDFSPTS